jgi:predicted RNA-binding protein with PIN domain
MQTVVFDGGVPGGEDHYLSTSKVKVLFAPGNLSADDLIIARINRVDNPTEYMVVTSDREVQSAAKKRKLALITSEDFSPMVDATESGDDNGEFSTDPEISEDELSEWLELFNGSHPEADS